MVAQSLRVHSASVVSRSGSARHARSARDLVPARRPEPGRAVRSCRTPIIAAASMAAHPPSASFLLMRRRKGLLRRAYVLSSAATWWRRRRSVCPGPLSGARRLTRSCCRTDCSGSLACAPGGSPASGSACADDGLGPGALSVRQVAGRWYGLGALVLGRPPARTHVLPGCRLSTTQNRRHAVASLRRVQVAGQVSRSLLRAGSPALSLGRVARRSGARSEPLRVHAPSGDRAHPSWR